MKWLVISDIHGNLDALNRVIEDAKSKYEPDQMVMLGDMIDYGMRSNEVIDRLKNCEIPILKMIWGNHEDAVVYEKYERFSSERGRNSAKRTRENLSDDCMMFLKGMEHQDGKALLVESGKKVLLVHGSIEDPLWGKIFPLDLLEGYAEYDLVLCGHTHQSFSISKFYHSEDSPLRKQKKTEFLNPGSVGQPRNHNPRAQYAIIDFDAMTTHLCSVEYDIALEQRLFTADVDTFYRDRLSIGV